MEFMNLNRGDVVDFLNLLEPHELVSLFRRTRELEWVAEIIDQAPEVLGVTEHSTNVTKKNWYGIGQVEVRMPGKATNAVD